MGDVLQILPLLDGLKARHPEATLDLLVGEAYQKLVEGHEHLDRIFTLPLGALNRGAHRGTALIQALKNLNSLIGDPPRRYDLVINRQFSALEMGISGLLRSNRALGPRFSYHPAANGSPLEFLNHVLEGGDAPEGSHLEMDPLTSEHVDAVLHHRRTYGKNLVDVSLDLCGIETPGAYRLPLTPAHRRRAGKLLAAAGAECASPILGIQSGAGTPFRRLARSLVVGTVNRWYARRGGRVLFFGTAAERGRIHEIIDALERPEAALNLAGLTSMLELAALLERTDLVLTPDTGTLHLAAAVGTPTVSLFHGAAYPWETGPYGTGHIMLFVDLPCVPCRNPEACVLDAFCRTLPEAEDLLSLLELSLNLRRAGDSATRDRLLAAWRLREGSRFAARKLSVFHTGFEGMTRPLRLKALIAGEGFPPQRSPPLFTRQGSRNPCNPGRYFLMTRTASFNREVLIFIPSALAALRLISNLIRLLCRGRKL